MKVTVQYDNLCHFNYSLVSGTVDDAALLNTLALTLAFLYAVKHRSLYDVL